MSCPRNQKPTTYMSEYLTVVDLVPVDDEENDNDDADDADDALSL